MWFFVLYIFFCFHVLFEGFRCWTCFWKLDHRSNKPLAISFSTMVVHVWFVQWMCNFSCGLHHTQFYLQKKLCLTNFICFTVFLEILRSCRLVIISSTLLWRNVVQSPCSFLILVESVFDAPTPFKISTKLSSFRLSSEQRSIYSMSSSFVIEDAVCFL